MSFEHSSVKKHALSPPLLSVGKSRLSAPLSEKAPPTAEEISQMSGTKKVLLLGSDAPTGQQLPREGDEKRFKGILAQIKQWWGKSAHHAMRSLRTRTADVTESTAPTSPAAHTPSAGQAENDRTPQGIASLIVSLLPGLSVIKVIQGALPSDTAGTMLRMTSPSSGEGHATNSASSSPHAPRVHSPSSSEGHANGESVSGSRNYHRAPAAPYFSDVPGGIHHLTAVIRAESGEASPRCEEAMQHVIASPSARGECILDRTGQLIQTAVERSLQPQSARSNPLSTALDFQRAARQNRSEVTLLTERNVAGETIREYFVQHQGKNHFAGWERAGHQGDARVSVSNMPMWSQGARRNEHDHPFFQAGNWKARDLVKRLDDEGCPSDVSEKLIDLIVEQFQAGCESLTNPVWMKSFNAYLRKKGYSGKDAKVSPEDWQHLLKQTLTLSLRTSPAFDEHGLRSLNAILGDSALLLCITRQSLSEWQERLGIGGIEKIAREMTFPAGHDETSLFSSLLEGLETQLCIRARAKIKGDPLLNLSELQRERRLEWRIAGICLFPEGEVRNGAACELISDLKRSSDYAAARALALIVLHSALLKECTEHPTLAPRWSCEELHLLVKKLMKREAWETLSHRSFRQHLSPDQSAFFNKAILSANFEHAIEQMQEIDVTKLSSDDEFWDAMDDTGQAMDILNNAITRMSNKRYI